MNKKTGKKQSRELLAASSIEAADRKLAGLFIITIAVLPLLMRLKIIEFIAPGIIAPILDTGMKTDIFSYYKWVFLLCLTGIVMAVFLFKILACHFPVRQSYLNIPLLFIVLFLLVAVLTAENKSIALVGLYNQYDGALTYLCYLTLLFVAANTVIKEWFSKYLTYALGTFVAINLIIALFHFYGHDLFQSALISRLIIPPNYETSRSGALFSTLANPNYLSGLAAAIFAFFFTYVLMNDSLGKSLLYIILSVAAFALILASMSSSGFVSVIIVAPVIVGIAVYNRYKKQVLVAGGITMFLCAVIFCGMNIENPALYNETFGVIKQVPAFSLKTPEKPAGENDKRQTEEQSQQSADKQSMPSDCFKLPASGYSAGSGRIYIWKNTLSLIKERPVTGYGQDTLAYYFPQNDINKISNLRSYQVLVTKPHNMYLGFAYGSGIPALLALLVLFLRHFYYTAKNLLQTKPLADNTFRAALFFFFCTFSVQWLFNDSIIGTSAIFWLLFGIGASLNTARENR